MTDSKWSTADRLLTPSQHLSASKEIKFISISITFFQVPRSEATSLDLKHADLVKSPCCTHNFSTRNLGYAWILGMQRWRTSFILV
jgi:hypothetical protein